MSEWVDFGLYALQAVLLWIVLPAWGVRLLQPLAARGTSGWVLTLRAWGVLSVLALLAYQLDRIPPPLAARALHRPGWEALLMTSNLMLALGLLLAGFGALRLLQWLRDSTTPEERPLGGFLPTRDELLPLALQRLAYALLLAGLLARPVAGLLRPEEVHDVWGNFVTGLAIAVLLLAAAAGSVARAPNRLDRVLGEGLRRVEVVSCYLLMTYLALLEMAGLALELQGLASRRHAALLLAGFVSLTLASLMLVIVLSPGKVRKMDDDGSGFT
jgi:hypothetical protein